MQETTQTTKVVSENVQQIIDKPTWIQAIVVLLICIILAYWVSYFVARGIIKLAKYVAVRGDAEANESRFLVYRQVETYLNIVVAGVRALMVAGVAVIAWKLIDTPKVSGGAAAIGASAFFIVIAGQTVGPILKDVTIGIIMMAEKWFNVGDHVKIEPFIDVGGVVEQVTLRSTKLRSLSGEVVWIHNQQIQAVHVTPNGVRTIAVDVFVRDRAQGEAEVEKIIDTIPVGPTLLARPLRIKYAERWNDDLWRITIVGQTPPGREWLVQDYFINILKEVDAGKPKSKQLFVHEPIARFDDPEAARRFRRAVRIRNES